MYKKPQPLKATDHADLRLRPISDYSFARGQLVAPIVIDEIADVAREYPIVFPAGGALPVALMGVEEGANAYVAPSGQWLATYIPAYIRHYPLAITRIPPQAEEVQPNGQAAQPRFGVLIDVESPAVSRDVGAPLFDEEGKLSATAQEKVRIMDLMQSRAGLTERLVRAIDEAGLLMERPIRIKREGEPGRQVTGVRVIDEAALNKMDDAIFNKMRASGALPLIYAALLSWANFRQGPIGKSHPLPAAPALAEEDMIQI